MPFLGEVVSSLEYLGICSNPIRHIPYDYFENFTRLEGLALTSLGLRQMPDFSFLAGSLTNINMRNNNITECQSLCKVMFEKLQTVTLVNNQLRVVNYSEVLNFWPKAHKIKLGFNPLENVPDLRNVKLRERYLFLHLEVEYLSSSEVGSFIILVSLVMLRAGDIGTEWFYHYKLSFNTGSYNILQPGREFLGGPSFYTLQ